MKVKIGDKTHEVKAHTAEPVIEVGAEEQGERYSLGVTHIDVTNEQGVIGRFWVDVRVVRGRPELIIRTKTGKDKDKTTEKRLTGTFNTL